LRKVRRQIETWQCKVRSHKCDGIYWRSLPSTAKYSGTWQPSGEALRSAQNVYLNQLFDLEDSQEGLQALIEKRKSIGTTDGAVARAGRKDQSRQDRYQKLAQPVTLPEVCL
jgi:hypothetical protein